MTKSELLTVDLLLAGATPEERMVLCQHLTFLRAGKASVSERANCNHFRTFCSADHGEKCSDCGRVLTSEEVSARNQEQFAPIKALAGSGDQNLWNAIDRFIG